jgi:hypothetical protein
VAADQLEREIRLAVAHPLGGPGADDVRDRLDQVLEVRGLGLIVGGEVKLIQRVLATGSPSRTAPHQRNQQQPDEGDAGSDLRAGPDEGTHGCCGEQPAWLRPMP